MKRRNFIANSVRIALGARAAMLLSGGFAPAALAATSFEAFDDSEVRTLVALTRAMFPHREIDDRHYVEVVARLDARVVASAELRELVRGGLMQLDESSGGRWIDASVDEKLQAMESLQAEPFFGLILNHTIDVLYRDPEVLAYLGYQGSSIEYGGYLNRGFDDIDWLPES
ncbi:MAG: hypothetical protein ACR2QV_14880 [Gammaproteobacteria bacterium]